MRLEEHIIQLIKSHNCVIVPDFGGFIANYESAWINDGIGIIYPPYKQVLFNANLRQNDGLLAHAIVLANGMSYNDALNEIEGAVKSWKKCLTDGDRLQLGEIGFLFQQGSQIIFEQSRELNLLLQAYGFKQIPFSRFIEKPAVETSVLKSARTEFVLKSGEKETVTKSDSIEKKDKPEVPIISLHATEKIEPVAQEKLHNEQIIPIKKPTNKRRKYIYAAAAAAIIPALFYSYWIPMRTDFLNTGKIEAADFNPFNKQVSSTYKTRTSNFDIQLESDWKSWNELTGSLPESVSIYNLEVTDELFIPVKLKENVSGTSSFNSDGDFHLIAGCFSIETNAANLVKQLQEKGYSAGIVDHHKGLYRVSAGSYASETDAENALNQFRQQGHSGWILH